MRCAGFGAVDGGPRRGLDLTPAAARTLVLGGDHDELIGDEPTRELAAAIPGARHEVIADAGHDLTLEQPEVTARRVADFFLAAADRP